MSGLVLRRLAESLVWRDASGALFRIAEDLTAATCDDETKSLRIEPVKGVHAAHRRAHERAQ